MAQTLINVSNRLPVTLKGDEVVKSSGGLVAALEGMSDNRYTPRWLGWPGGGIDDPDRQRAVRDRLERECGCTPVFLSDEEVEAFYEGFSNASLWPLLHYMPSRFRYEPAWWDHYQTVNRRFADAVLAVAKDDDLVWVHDYQLMLMPAMLKEARPSLRVGFFLHTPFPSYEVFRFHPKRDELAAGLLGADLVGFHTFGYLRHYRSSVLRLLGIESEVTEIRNGGRTTTLGVYPIGINAKRFAEQLDAPSHAGQVARFVESFQGKRIVVSVERMDYTKGILHRLDAIDLFLAAASREERDRIKFIFVSVPSREGIEEYKELRDEVEMQIGRLNGRYTTLDNSPVHFIHGSVRFEELCALYALAEVALVTPLIDGMNLVAKEYIACQRDDPGVLILSEFAGAAEELFNALIVNPHDARGVAECLDRALRMDETERADRMRPMRERVMTVDAGAWAQSFVDDLSRQDVSARVSGTAAQGRVEETKRRLREAVAAGQRVGLFLDYDGTLREIERDPDAARPSDAVRATLGRLAGVPNVEVTVISGRTPKDLESFLGSYPFGLIAEHGADVRRPGQTQWAQLDRNLRYDWKEPVLRILRLFADATPGSFIEDKRTGLVWHYRRADPEFGAWKAKELVDELAQVTANDPVHVRHGKKIVEVAAFEVNKGAAVARLLEERPYDLVLVSGDDVTDESMFRFDRPNLISVKIGDGETHAQIQLPTPAAFRRFLDDAVG